jgi:WD40 repeat protein
LNQDYFASGGGDYNLILWRYNDDRPLKVMQGHKNVIVSLLYPTNCTEKDLVVSGSFQEIRIWKISTGECINYLIGHDDRISNLVYLHDYTETRDIIASASIDCTIRLWKLSKADYVKRIETGNANPVIAVAYLDSKIFGRNVACCVTKDKLIKLFEVDIL